MIKTIAVFVIIALTVLIPPVAHKGLKLRGGKMRAALGVNLFSFFTLLSVLTVCMWTGNISVFADTADAAAAGGLTDGMRYLGAALSTGLACIGAGIAVASSASAALGAISEDPQIMGKSLIFVALAEGIALYGLIISLLILFQ